MRVVVVSLLALLVSLYIYIYMYILLCYVISYQALRGREGHVGGRGAVPLATNASSNIDMIH